MSCLSVQSGVSMSPQCGSCKTAEHKHGELHWKHKGPGLQQQGSALHSTLLSAYPFHHVTESTAARYKCRWMAMSLVSILCTFLKSHIMIECDGYTACFCSIVFFPSLFSSDILLNRSQQLFASCTAKFADGQQCSIPVFDITHQTPLCEEHAKKMVSSTFKGKVQFFFWLFYSWECD